MASSAPRNLRARMGLDTLFVIDVAVRDAFNEINERYRATTGDTRGRNAGGLSKRLQDMWRKGRRAEVRDILRTPYQGGRNAVEVDQAAEELSQQYAGTRAAGEKSWVGDIISVVIDLAENGGDLGGDADAQAEEARKAAAREAARSRLQAVTVAVVAFAVMAVGLFIFNRRA